MKLRLFKTTKNIFKEMRIHHWIKNLLVLAPLFFSGTFLDSQKLVSCALAFFAFCFVSSAIYILNDICDIEKDKNHPTKCKRPIASGEISLPFAWTIFSVLVIFAFAFSFFSGEFIPCAIILIYFVLNLLYSFGAKNIPLLDICILVSGFFLRVLLGSVVADCKISNWFYLTVISVSFCMALGKRRGELLKYAKEASENKLRRVLSLYSPNFLDKNMYVFIAMSNIFYALWAMDKESSIPPHRFNFLWTVPIVILITLRYSFVLEGKSDGDPVEVLLHDKVLLLLCVLYAALIFAALYF